MTGNVTLGIKDKMEKDLVLFKMKNLKHLDKKSAH